MIKSKRFLDFNAGNLLTARSSEACQIGIISSRADYKRLKNVQLVCIAGPLLVRLRKTRISFPSGCVIGMPDQLHPVQPCFSEAVPVQRFGNSQCDDELDARVSVQSHGESL